MRPWVKRSHSRPFGRRLAERQLKRVMVMESFWAFVIVQAVVCGGFCAFVAGQKNRDSITWFLLGFFFSVFALIAIAGVPVALEERRADNAPPKLDEAVYEQRRRDAMQAAIGPNPSPSEAWMAETRESDMHWLGDFTRQLLVQWRAQTFSVLLVIGVGFAAASSGGSLLGVLWAVVLNPPIWLAAYVYSKAGQIGGRS